jgi:ParB/RepB/Spo0J family partition protein
MSGKRGPWIDRRGQANLAVSIDQVLDLRLQPGEQIQQMPDEQIEDSPYQARQSFSDEHVEDLAQGMREVGFQGVLIVRPHNDVERRRHGFFQLVYGHRRRAAWRRVCAERGEACTLPVIVREIDDTQMLTIGAQENLQRQDLDPVEEAQIVAWHERMFFDKNQAEIGAMLGKSSDWISVRSRIHRLPDALKACLRQRPRAIKQMLELGSLYAQQPTIALSLAGRVVGESLTAEAVRSLIYDVQHRTVSTSHRDEKRNRRAGTTVVQQVTNSPLLTPLTDQQDIESGGNNAMSVVVARDTPGLTPSSDSGERSASASSRRLPRITRSASEVTIAPELLLQEAVVTLVSLAACAETIPANPLVVHMLDQAEDALAVLRRAITRHALPCGVEVVAFAPDNVASP